MTDREAAPCSTPVDIGPDRVDDPAPRIPGLTVQRCRGHGATGAVYTARRDLDGWTCAVKVISTPHSADPRIRREIDVLTAFRSPGLIRLHEVVSTDDGRLALILDHLDAGVLRDLLARRGRLLERETLGVLRAILPALQMLHAGGITHGDISASNILVNHYGRAVLSDLGSARLVGDHHDSIYGTRGYTAPELHLTGQVTPATDMYALGAVCWLMLAGAIPPDRFHRKTAVATFPDIDTRLAELIDACLSAHPTQRPDAAHARQLCASLGADEPLALPDAPDLGGSLTHRIREDRTPRPALLTGSADLDRLSAPAPGDNEPPAGSLEGRHRGADPSTAEVLLTRSVRAANARGVQIAGSIAMGVLLGTAAWHLAGRELFAQAAPAPTPTTITMPTAPPPTAPQHPSPPTTSTASGPSPTDVAAATDLLHRLLQERAAAYAEATPDRVNQCYDPSTTVATQARADVLQLHHHRRRYLGLSYAVRSVTMPTSGPFTQGEPLQLIATVDTSAYRVQDDAEPHTSHRRPETPGTPLMYTLRETPQGWRITEISPVTSHP
ncbi:Serine/threonine-protein kinase PknD [Austwickia sp. TVS 96-490-7B]|uniref:serine/threonine-protein kinase n=1 Tax=Austwickia sp. TVS 96-490-7B TaxID=2830843 RepID=UPI001C55F919|nr:serine/threonine-protein kinase [Austwickia sp. TVS 96-490-7B]MBW3086406.1 Serine/threonine-protein kinase PknD [Austwickia sp. TVS 96-490-7B]